MSDDPQSVYLHAFRRSVATPAGTRARNLAEIRRRSAEASAVVVVEDESTPVRPRHRWAASVFAVKMASLSVGLGALGLGAVKLGVVAVTAITPEPEPEAEPHAAPSDSASVSEPVARSRRSTAPQSAHPDSIAAPAVEAPPPAVGPVAAPMPPRVPSSPRRKADAKSLVEGSPSSPASEVSDSPEDRLRQELELLKLARQHLDAGRNTAAIAALESHAKRFPSGAMAQERRAWRSIAGCEQGESGARTRAGEFIRRHARSPLADKVGRACGIDVDSLMDSKASRD